MKSLWHRRRFIGAAMKVAAAVALARSALLGVKASAAQLTLQETETLRRVGFLMFPYPDLGAAPYERIVKGIAADASGNGDLRQMISNGIASLDAARAGDFLSLAEATQLEVLTDLEGTPFFAYLLQKTRDDLYNNPQVWAHIGYEGSSLEFGGYIDRGLNDIDWLNGK